MRGSVEVLEDLVRALRTDAALVRKLPEAGAIYPGHPTEDRGYPVGVIVTPIFEGSQRHRGVLGRRYRVQVTVIATQPWREARDAEAGTDNLRAMRSIMDAVAAVLDEASGMPEWPEGAESGLAPQPVGDGRLSITNDWVVAGAYLA